MMKSFFNTYFLSLTLTIFALGGFSQISNSTYYFANTTDIPLETVLTSVSINSANQLNLSDIINAATLPPVMIESSAASTALPDDTLITVTSSGVV